MTTTKYTFETTPTYDLPTGKKKHHRRQPSKDSVGDLSADPTDGNGSLTYSAASSINSAAGESTDSSLAGIMKVLDVQDSKELAAVLEKERIRKHGTSSHYKDERSVAESAHSLTYSTDAESHMRSLATDQDSALHGTGILNTITGQTSDQFAYDGGSFPHGERQDEGSFAPEASDDLIFSPAEHTDSLKRRKDKKRRERKLADETPRVKNSKKPLEESRQGTPPSARPPKARGENVELYEEEDVWYAKWWMFCFPDTVKTMTPKR